MNTGKKYKTKQKSFVLQCLRECAGAYLTIHQICDWINKDEYKISLTTIYRNIDNLVAEQQIVKIRIQGHTGMCYRYQPEAERSVFLLRCKVCGRFVYIRCPELEYVCSHVDIQYHIKIDPAKTTFYGICEGCLQMETEVKEVAYNSDSNSNMTIRNLVIDKVRMEC